MDNAVFVSGWCLIKAVLWSPVAAPAAWLTPVRACLWAVGSPIPAGIDELRDQAEPSFCNCWKGYCCLCSCEVTKWWGDLPQLKTEASQDMGRKEAGLSRDQCPSSGGSAGLVLMSFPSLLGNCWGTWRLFVKWEKRHLMLPALLHPLCQTQHALPLSMEKPQGWYAQIVGVDF